MYFLPKIHKRLSNIPGRTVISNFGTPTEKASEFLDSHLIIIMQEDSGCFINKMNDIVNIPENVILAIPDVVVLSQLFHIRLGSKCIKMLWKRENKSIFWLENYAISQSLCSKTKFLDLMVLLNNKFQKRPLVQNVLPLTPVYL